MSEFLDTAIEAARKAEDIIFKHFDTGVSVETKPDNSPVTVADREAERIIKEIVLGRFPDHGFLGEETGENREKSEYTWIVDPIDGTKNYVRGIPLFGTLIALMKNEEVVLGVVNMPVLKELSYAERGNGAFHNGERIHVSGVSSLNDAYVGFGGVKKFQQKGMTKELLSITNATRSDKGLGDCWSYTLIARGKLDALVDATIKIWDVAAPSIIIEEAGGMITDLTGKAIGRDTTSVIATNGFLHGAVLAYFNS